MLNIRHNRTKQAKAAHRSSLQRRLAQRLESARSQGDESLIRQLQEEARYLNIDI
ncbi:hypothetical protein Lepto7376_0941 [[Leptolyngbya] sp. PCC 7376]|uniref:arginine synthesis PII-interacting regulator PirA n=1 Tax=[Leptolyngbya] sp. PCC 7376 TaxID=111781 RepID=UPI00029F1C65|nr:hypothetical protein [[Leptolyngbya] sp. PCC 7376]AFY37315.1 hypothetical protein Lepto7376_0941 [[Leptolyngbya] sp. PCC 7376]